MVAAFVFLSVIPGGNLLFDAVGTGGCGWQERAAGEADSPFDFSQGNGNKKSKGRSKQQIPFGDDNKKSRSASPRSS
jgi:hypothetical protein